MLQLFPLLEPEQGINQKRRYCAETPLVLGNGACSDSSFEVAAVATMTFAGDQDGEDQLPMTSPWTSLEAIGPALCILAALLLKLCSQRAGCLGGPPSLGTALCFNFGGMFGTVLQKPKRLSHQLREE
ncbi:hypothetical protein CB1_001264048 [Camelus ferus]|nr:hypothetical protein CB1_001264048 [Camelus ferus]